MATKILNWLFLSLLGLLAIIGGFLSGTYGPEEMRVLAGSLLISWEEPLSREQRLWLAESFPNLDFAAFACRKESSNGTKIGFLRGESQTLSAEEKIYCPGGLELSTETGAKLGIFGNEKQYRIQLSEGSIWTQSPKGSLRFGFGRVLATVDVQSSQALFRIDRAEVPNLFCANGIVKTRLVDESGKLTLGAGNCTVEVRSPAFEGAAYLYFGEGNTLDSFPKTQFEAVKQWVFANSKPGIVIEPNRQEDGNLTVHWWVKQGYLQFNNCHIDLLTDAARSSTEVKEKVNEASGTISLPLTKQDKYVAMVCQQAGNQLSTSVRREF